MISIIDDSYKLLSDNLKENQYHSRYSIISRILWSKTFNEEQDSPDQIFLGAHNRAYCILIALSTWLELFISKGHIKITDFAFGVHDQNDPIIIKEKADDFMEKIFNDDDSIIIIEGKRGTCSIRNMYTTRARRNGCSKDETDTRAIWKKRR